MDILRKLLIAGWACFGVTFLILIISAAVLSQNANGKLCPVPKKCPVCPVCPPTSFFYDSPLVCTIGKIVSFSPSNAVNCTNFSSFPSLSSYGLNIDAASGVISGTVNEYQTVPVKFIISAVKENQSVASLVILVTPTYYLYPTMPAAGINTMDTSISYEIGLANGGNIPNTNTYKCKYKITGANFNGMYGVQFNETNGKFSGDTEDGQILFTTITLVVEIKTMDSNYVVELGIYNKL